MSNVKYVCPYTGEDLYFDGEKYSSKSGNVFFIKNNYSISRIDQSITNGYVNSIVFKKTNFNKKIDDNLFYFDKENYKDYYVNKL